MADMSWLGSAIQGTNGLIGAILQFVGNRETNKSNELIANNNLDFQRENLDYEKSLQKQIFEREDNQYQRTVNDMRLAGLNPLSMQGTNGAGEAIATEPMHNDFVKQNELNGVFDVMNTVMNMKNNNSIAQAQSNLINQQAENQRIKNIYESDILENALEGSNLENIGKRFQNERSNIQWLNDLKDYQFNDQFRLSNNMPDWLKAINIATNQGKYNTKHFSKLSNKTWNEFGNDPLQFDMSTYNPFNTIDSILQNNNLKGALMENKLGEILLSLIGIK